MREVIISPFGGRMGIEVVDASLDRVEVRLVVTADLTNLSGGMHGGAIMAMADIVGGMATVLNLEPGKMTTTIESKTNFLRPIPGGAMANAVCIPLHKGRRTMVWQTTISVEPGGKPAAIIIQTQLLLDGSPVPASDVGGALATPIETVP